MLLQLFILPLHYNNETFIVYFLILKSDACICVATLKGWSLVLYGTVASHPGVDIRRKSSRQVRVRASDRHQRAPAIYSRNAAAAAVPTIDCLVFNCLLCVYYAWLSVLAAACSV